jgi:hypothetical protein
MKIEDVKMLGAGKITIGGYVFYEGLKLFDSFDLFFNDKYVWFGDANNVVVASGIKESV